MHAPIKFEWLECLQLLPYNICLYIFFEPQKPVLFSFNLIIIQLSMIES
jgi:hypothetical protein